MGTLEPTEPWLRGIDLGVHPALAQPLFALEQVREDVSKHTRDLTGAQIWACPHGLTPVGFHLKHLAGSTGRLAMYLNGEQLSDSQFAELLDEKTPGPDRGTLLERLKSEFEQAKTIIRAMDPDEFGSARYVGRKRIPTTAIGLAIHIGEHAHRHAGQIISGCHLVRALQL